MAGIKAQIQIVIGPGKENLVDLMFPALKRFIIGIKGQPFHHLYSNRIFGGILKLKCFQIIYGRIGLTRLFR